MRPVGSVDPSASNGTDAPALTVISEKPITAVGGVSTPYACENSEVLPAGSVTVAVTNRAPVAGVGNSKEKLAFPVTLVMSVIEPRTYRPSP